MNKKITSLAISTILSTSLLVGCNDNEVKEQQIQEHTQQDEVQEEPIQEKVEENIQEEVEQDPIQQEEQVEESKDEDLNDEYNDQIKLEEAKAMVESAMASTFGASGLRYRVEIVEDSNTIMGYTHLTAVDIALSTQEDWDELTTNVLESSNNFTETFEELGYDNVNISFGVGDMDNDSYYFITFNNIVMYDAVEANNIQLN